MELRRIGQRKAFLYSLEKTWRLINVVSQCTEDIFPENNKTYIYHERARPGEKMKKLEDLEDKVVHVTHHRTWNIPGQARCRSWWRSEKGNKCQRTWRGRQVESMFFYHSRIAGYLLSKSCLDIQLPRIYLFSFHGWLSKLYLFSCLHLSPCVCVWEGKRKRRLLSKWLIDSLKG